MADNSTLPATGDIIAADDLAGVKYQRVKPVWGVDGVVQDISASTALPTVGASLSQADAGLDANSTATVGTALTLNGARLVALQVDNASGTFATHVFKIQVSADGVTYHNSSGAVTGEGIAEIETAFAYARAAVTTAEGGASTADIVLQAK